MFGGDPWSDQKIVSVFQALGFDPLVFAEFCDVVKGRSAFSLADVPGEVAAFVSGLHSDSWFAVEGLSTFAKTENGSKPGDAFGDIIFFISYLQGS